MFMWWRDVIKEAHGGDHTPVVQLHLRYGMILFIASEVMFFVAWFWAYFDAALFPAAIYPIDITTPDGTVEATKEIFGMVERDALSGGHWPPKPARSPRPGLLPGHVRSLGPAARQHADPADVGHHRDVGPPRAARERPQGPVWGLLLTVILGVLFTACQAYEYVHAGFSYAGHIYGSTFFMATGFHGAHVIIGTLFLAVCLFRAHGRPLHAQAALRLRGGRLVLALRRRGLAVPVHVHLRVGRRHAGPALTGRPGWVDARAAAQRCSRAPEPRHG